MKEELRVIPKKNYFILGAVILVTLLLLYYFYMWFDAYNESKINKPILDKYIDVINYNELDDYLVENPNSIIYVSVLENEEIRNFEKKLKSNLKNNKIDNILLYMDITDDITNDKVKNEMKNKYNLNSLSILDVPAVLVFKNGELDTIYSVSDNDFDISKFILFVNGVNFSNYD